MARGRSSERTRWRRKRRPPNDVHAGAGGVVRQASCVAGPSEMASMFGSGPTVAVWLGAVTRLAGGRGLALFFSPLPGVAAPDVSASRLWGSPVLAIEW